MISIEEKDDVSACVDVSKGLVGVRDNGGRLQFCRVVGAEACDANLRGTGRGPLDVVEN